MNLHLSTLVPQCTGFPASRSIAVQFKKIPAFYSLNFCPFSPILCKKIPAKVRKIGYGHAARPQTANIQSF